MSLFWEQAVSESPASQNVAHSELGRSTDTRQIVPGGNWDNINRSCASSQMGYESQHNSYHSSTAVDPYGAAVMGAYQERTETSTKCVQNSIRSSVLQNERIGETVEVALSLQDQRSVLPKRQHTQQLNCQPGDAQMTLSVQSSTALSLCEPVVDVDSAQVAPESLYSLDTLGSDQSNDQREQLQGVNCSSVGLQIQKEERSSKNCEDESGCAKHLKESVTSEVHANNSTNQKVSRPYPCVENFSETPPQPTTNGSSHNYGKVNIDSLEVTYRSAPSTAVVGVQRCEETCRTQDYMPAIAQVAPLRPELDSVLCVQSPTVNTADQTPLIDEEIYSDTENTRYQLSRPTEEAFTTASVMKNETNLSQSVSLAKQAVHALNEQIPPPQVTPDLQPFDNSLSPFAIKESSTPIDASLSNIRNANNDIERWEPEENKSSNNFYPTANPSEELSVTRSNNKTAESSARNGSERRSVQSRYRMFKEHFSGIMGRLDQYRTEPTRSDFRSSSRTGNPLMANVASRSGSFPGCQAIKHKCIM
ncbi:hypothetical protein DICVIV_12609 [Dictyocaulus viviparus]|uniref:Uncharacterized protein n=1 Tax=Dictyocaulus viviparus TaxID=29172 RepID=A0A0D8XCC1_DICVI|nr:hypothetical protein DICVIV_12609 [Dictyocaulus viviparus]